jgi:hypothetical protein
MEKTQVENWISQQILSNIVDISIAPVLIILVKTFLKEIFQKYITFSIAYISNTVLAGALCHF